ncbi:MAG: putative Ig domain-containing protein [Clostridia bacterium]|nr:putative Ig domain-containing protein [Clostridia bacterium]
MKKNKFILIVLTIVALSTLLAVSLLPVAAAQPAIQFGNGSTLLVSAPDAKSTSVGSLSAVGTSDGTLSENTVLDTSRSFSVYETSASTVIGGTLEFTYSGATVGTDEYVSAILADKTGKILYYGKLKNSGTASGSVSMTVPTLLNEATYTLYLFSEKDNATGNDVASSFSSVSLFVYTDPHVTTTSLPETTQGVNYTKLGVKLQAESTSSSLKWSIISGSLPSGLYLNSSTGAITGSPTKAGTYGFTVKVAAGSSYHTQTLTLKVNPEMTIDISSDISTGSLKSIEIPRGRTVTLKASITGGTAPYSNYRWNVNGGDPISGADSLTYKIPTSVNGTYTYTFAATDGATANSSASVTVTVRDPIAPTVKTDSLKYDRAVPTTVSFDKNDGDYPFSGIITVGTKKLTEGTDFTVSGDKITLTKTGLDKLPLGTSTLVLDYGDTTSDPKITITVIDTSMPPVVGAITAPAAIDRGEKLTLTAPTVSTYGSPVTTQGWKIKNISGTSYVDFDPSTTLDCSYNGVAICYYATNAAGTSYSNEVKITVNHTPSSTWQKDKTQHWRVCDCGEKFDVAGHTCDAAGDCTTCGYRCTHVYSSYTNDNNATCTTDATKTRYCTQCGYRDTVSIENTKSGHTWSIWQISETEHWKVCTVCGTKSEHASHIAGEPATTTTPQTCTVCGKVLAPKLPENTTVVTPPTTTAPDPVITTPSGGGDDTTTPGASDTTTIPTPTTPDKPAIDLDRKDGDDNENPTFISDSDMTDVIIITVDGRPLTKDEYTLSPDGKEITLHPVTPIEPGDHTLIVETEDGDGEIDFTIEGAGDDSKKCAFPFWLLWVVPHVLADIAGLVCIIILIVKKKNNDEDPTDENSTDNEKE